MSRCTNHYGAISKLHILLVIITLSFVSSSALAKIDEAQRASLFGSIYLAEDVLNTQQPLNENETEATLSNDFEKSVSILNSLADIFLFSVRLPRAVSSHDGQLGSNNSKHDNCTNPHDKGSYESSCKFVLAECGKKSELINYLAFVLCDLPNLEPVAYVVMAAWLIYLIALLATTVDHYFVPPLNFLSEKMKLSPSIAGITLLALGNGAPDIFVVFSGIAQDDTALVLGSLSGGGLFVTTVVLGTVVMAANLTLYKIDKLDFMRDLIAYLLVVAVIVAVAYDGIVHLFEACLFPALYFIYLTFVITVSYIRVCIKKRNQPERKDLLDEIMYYDEESASNLTLSNSMAMEPISSVKKTQNDDQESLIELPRELEDDSNKCYLAGLSWPAKSNIIVKFIWFIQLPFSLLRCITIPPFSPDGRWCIAHYILASFSPLPLSLLILIAVKGWKGFIIFINVIPLPVIVILAGAVLSLFLFSVLRPRKPPHWCVKILLVPLSFASAIVWLNIIANEAVSILRAFGLLLNIDTAILGLTVLAIGNSVADWVANTVIAKSDKPQMAFASCFGAPLLSHVVGLSFAIIVKIVIYQYGAPFQFDISDPAYAPVKLAWVFLGVSLIMTALVFLIFKFSPRKIYGVVLLLVYILFVVFAILEETHILPVYF